MRYTHCATLADYKAHWPANSSQGPFFPVMLNAIKQGAIFGALGAAVGAILFGASGLSATLGAGVLGLIFFNYAFVEGFCDQWLKWRLICVEKDTCAMGRVAWAETVDKKFQDDVTTIEYLFDNDLSFNLRMMPFNGKHPDGTFEFEADDTTISYGLDKIFGAGVKEYRSSQLLQAGQDLRDAGKDIGLKYHGYVGSSSPHKPIHPGGRWTIHCEIEGDGMHVLCSIAKAVSILGPFAQGSGALIASAYVAGVLAYKAYQWVHRRCKKACGIPIICDVVCFVVAAAAAAVTFLVMAQVGAIIGALPGIGPLATGSILGLFFRHNGDWHDVQNDPDAGEIHPGDCVIVVGDQVYDAGHDDGWTEIHPVIHLQKMCGTDEKSNQRFFTNEPDCCHGMLTGDPRFGHQTHIDEINTLWDTWCRAVKDGHRPEIIKEQAKYHNLWSVHPLVDGCTLVSQPRGPIVK